MPGNCPKHGSYSGKTEAEVLEVAHVLVQLAKLLGLSEAKDDIDHERAQVRPGHEAGVGVHHVVPPRRPAERVGRDEAADLGSHLDGQVPLVPPAEAAEPDGQGDDGAELEDEVPFLTKLISIPPQELIFGCVICRSSSEVKDNANSPICARPRGRGTEGLYGWGRPSNASGRMWRGTKMEGRGAGSRCHRWCIRDIVQVPRCLSQRRRVKALL
ncbi:uncharacterized protein PG986_010256 [Apiospora aurea]|uniref:Uncharacterized protein n=1 Tax=Apiospora aurea TaxID=335848 RepID=A0ABR1QA23_9PEZI